VEGDGFAKEKKLLPSLTDDAWEPQPVPTTVYILYLAVGTTHLTHLATSSLYSLYRQAVQIM
jgi:hypothetical protein